MAAALAALAVSACGPPALVPGQAVEGRLEPGGSAEYRIEAGAGEYLRVVVEPVGEDPGATLDARLADPRGGTVIEAPGISRAEGGVLAWVSSNPGSYRLELTAPGSPKEAHYRSTLEERRSARADDGDRTAAETARAAAVRLADASEIPAAIEALELQLQAWRRVDGATAAVVETLLDLIDVDRRSGLERALERCEEAIRLSSSEGLGSWHMKALNTKGILLRVRRDCAGARDVYAEAQAAALAEGDLSFAGTVAYNVGRLQVGCATRDDAEAAFRKAIDLGRRAGDAGLQAMAHRDLSVLARGSLDLISGREHLDRAWALVQESDDREAMADVIYERANLARSQGRLGEAREMYLRSLELNQELGREDLSLQVLLSLGGLALDLRRPEDAREHYRQALDRARILDDSAAVASAQLGLGAVEERSRRPAEAEELFRRSLAVSQELEEGPRRASLVGAANSRLGSLLLSEERAAEALPHLVDALEQQKEGSDPRARALTRRALGMALARTGDRAAAAAMFDQAIETGRELRDPISIAWTQYSHASVLSETDPDRARAVLEQAIATLEQVRTDLMVDTLRADFSDGPRRIYELYLDLLMTEGDTRAAFVASERGRARALLDLLAEARIDPQSGIDPRLREEAEELDQRMSWLRNELSEAAAAGAGGGAERTAALARLLTEAEQDWWRVEAALRKASPRYRELRSPEVVGVDELQRSLPPGRALLEYWLGRENAYVFVVTRESFGAVPLAETPRLVERAAAHRAAILGLHPPDHLAAAAQGLYRDLVEPALPLTRGAEELIVVPDGDLHFLPFETLVTTAAAPRSGFGDLDYLGDRAAISYAPSATVLTSLDSARASAAEGALPESGSGLRLVAFADPRHDRPLALDCGTGASGDSASDGQPLRSRSLDPLEGSREEVQGIARRYGDRARVYEGAEASEARAKRSRELASAEWLHFAVHGVICEAFPERSGLVLALDDDSVEDGFLQVREIFGLRLAAQMVVLSACDSGTGRVVSGEGVMGLARAFFYAGTPTLVVSLWPVSDRSTAALMESFYARLDVGDDPARALQRARRELIDSGGRHAAPFYWAPFVVLGSGGSRGT